ncbi:Liprin-alpha-4 [Intoshia linei]|uniref:Liprin-alpha-4 n=1 Tax=Intoshia linei TaxID=1819745 RepID=A0A177BDS7_9BILA|nr:Liprin-alpha-4 [Intoshia linei]
MNFDILPTIAEVSTSMEQLAIEEEGIDIKNDLLQNAGNLKSTNGSGEMGHNDSFDEMDQQNVDFYSDGSPNSENIYKDFIPINYNNDQLNGNVEQLMVSILDERDSLYQDKRNLQEKIENLQENLKIVQKDCDFYYSQLEENVTKDYALMLSQFNRMSQDIVERDDEILDLKAERQNVKLLLNHLEILISRHERSLRSTLMKRQNGQNSMNGSSEVEILKAMKSLFEHHKVLDEKVRDKLKVSRERVVELETELYKANEELLQSKDENNDKEDHFNDDGRLDLLEKENKTLKSKIVNLEANFQTNIIKIDEYEKDFRKHKTDMLHNQENYDKLKFDNENLLNVEKKLKTSLTLKDHTIGELKSKNSELYASLRQINKQNDANVKNNELVKCLNELTEAESRNEASREQYYQLELQLQEAVSELNRACKREKLNEDHNIRLSYTVDKLLNESCERLQIHMSEKIVSIDKNNEMKLKIESMQHSLTNLNNENVQLKSKLNALKENYDKSILELDYLRKEYKHRSTCNNDGEQFYNEYGTKLPINQSNLYNSICLNRIATLPKHMDCNNYSIESDIDQSNAMCSKEPLTLNSNAQNAAEILQQQLNAINNEIRLIQEEKNINDFRVKNLVNYVENSKNQSSPYICSPSSTLSSNIHLEANNPSYPADTLNKSSRKDLYKNDQIYLPSNCIQNEAFYNPEDAFNKRISLYTEKKLSNSKNNISETSSLSQTNGNTSQTEILYDKREKRSSILNISKYFRKKDKKKNKIYHSNSTESNTSFIKNEFKQIKNKKYSKIDEYSRVKQRHQLLLDTIKAGTPFHVWNGPTVVAWMELWVGMPLWYVAACRANINNGSIMMKLSDFEIQKQLGVANPLHRVKLRLAISEMISCLHYISKNPNIENCKRIENANVSPYSIFNNEKMITPDCTYPCIYNFIHMNHEWVGNEWLYDLGLSTYRSIFMENLVDIRMMKNLTRENYQNYFSITNPI